MKVATILLLVGVLSIICFTSGKSKNCRSLVRSIVKRAPKNSEVRYCCSYRKIEYFCKRGYYLVGGDKIRNCTNGILSGKEPRCQKKGKSKNCRSLVRSIAKRAPKNSEIRYCCSYRKIKYICKRGYYLVGGDEIRSCTNGILSGKEPRCQKKGKVTGKKPGKKKHKGVEVSCGRPLAIEHGNFTGTNFTAGKRVKYYCNKEYKLNKKRSWIECKRNGKWSKKPPKCKEIRCEPPSRLFLFNGNVTTTDPQYKYGAILSFRCNPGFVLRGEDTITCTGKGWTRRQFPSCRKPRCSDPGYPKNGRRFGRIFWVGQVVKFFCHSGFKLYGSKERRCLPNLRWSGTLTTCDNGRSYCRMLGKPINGRKRGNRYNLGDVVQFNCNNGYILRGSQARKCMENHKWNGTEALCIDEAEAFFKDANSSARFIRENIIDEWKDFTCSSENRTCNVTDSRARAIDLGHAGGLDLVFVFDGSSSVNGKDFKKELEFAVALVEILGTTWKPGGTQVAAVTYGTDATLVFNLGDDELNTADEVIKKIRKIHQPGGGTATRLALDEVRKVVAPNTRPSAQKVLFFITDGNSNIGGSPAKAAKILRNKKKFEIYAIGVGRKPKRRELMNIASKPEDEHVLLVKDVATLKKAIEDAKIVRIDYTPCGISKTNLRARIAGGTKVKPGTWPWQVGLYYEANKYPHCGGSLIDKRWVLTAAHCFEKDEKRIDSFAISFSVKVGDHKILKKDVHEQDPITAQEIFVHQNYVQYTFFNDIALIKLQWEVKLGKNVRTVCLPKDSKDDLATAGKHGFVAGWGVTQKLKPAEQPKRKDSRSNVLRHTSLTVQANGVCRNSTDKFKNMTVMFCTNQGTSGESDACSGDSGGPFVRERYNSDLKKHRWTQAGIVSWGEGCAHEDNYGFFTRVAPYVDWIKKTMKDNEKDEK